MTSNKISTIEQRLVKGFTLLRFPLAVFVIMIHHNYFRETAAYDGYGQVDTTLYQILKFLPRIAVPTFYIISGFFYFYRVEHFTMQQYRQKTKRRITSLLIPYLLWNLIAFAVLAGKELATGQQIIEGGLLHLKIFASSFFLYNGSTTPINAPLWFLRDLIIVILFTPLIYNAVKRVPILFIAALIFLFLTYGQTQFHKIYPAQLYTAPLFFSGGACLSIHKNRLLPLFRFSKWLSAVMTIVYVIGVVLIITNSQYEGIAKIITLNIIGVLMVIFIAYLIAEKSCSTKITKLNPTCFFLFALHFLLVNSTQTIVVKFCPIHSMTVYYVLSVALNAMLCMAAYYLCKRIMPKMASVLSGGR